MKPAPFRYMAPTSLSEVLAAISAGEDAKVLAGGQSLIPILSLRLAKFDLLVDLRKVDELRVIETTPESVRLGAMVIQSDAEQHPDVREGVPLLPQALVNVGHFQIRNRGTVGGSIAHADPAAELPAVALALDATMEIAGSSGRREERAGDFFVGTFTTSLGDDEILAAVRFPRWGPGSGFAVEEVGRRHGDFALVGAACGVQVTDGVVVRAAIGMFGMGPTPLRAHAAEAAIVGQAYRDVDVAELGRLATDGLDPPADIHASAGYRRSVGATVVAGGLARALQEATHG